MDATTAVAIALQLILTRIPPDAISPEVEIVAWSLFYGVNPHIALAVAEVETGHLSDEGGRRDRVISRGNYGRFQIRCKTWKRIFQVKDCSAFLDRHLNIRAGVAILAYTKALFARKNDSLGWVGHYNEGSYVTIGGRGERFARAVSIIMRRSQEAAIRRFGAWRGW